MTRALSQQQDFLDEKPCIQIYIEEKEHICLFLPKFHCELDPIEMAGRKKQTKSVYKLLARTRSLLGAEYRLVSNSKLATAKVLIPEILDSVNTRLIRKFFRKTWRYMDVYE